MFHYYLANECRILENTYTLEILLPPIILGRAGVQQNCVIKCFLKAYNDAVK
jgi:hypothetical protein